MRKSLLIIIFFISSLNIFGQNWLWAKSATGVGSNADEAFNVSTDISGNVYVTGLFQSPSITFGAYTLSKPGTGSIFLVKYNNLGSVIWAKSAGGVSSDEGWSVSTDSSCNIYLTGTFTSPTLTFGTFTLTNTGTRNIFLAKYDSAGTILWAKSSSGAGSNYSWCLATNVNKSIYVTGHYSAPSITFGSFTLNNTGSSDIFLTKYDTSGNVLWAKSFGGIYVDEALSVATDHWGNVYLTGHFNSPALTLGAYTLTSSTDYDIFIAKCDSSGTIVWAKKAGGSSDDHAYGVSTGKTENIYITGTFNSSSITFGVYTIPKIGYWDFFLAKYDSSGNALWVKNAGGGIGDDKGYHVSTDTSDNAYVSGGFTSNTITFGTYTLVNPSGSTDPMFVVKYDSSGNALCASALSSGGDDNNGIATDAFGNAYIGGDFMCNQFIVGTSSLTLSGSGAENIFVAKFTCDPTNSLKENSNNQEINIWPNPSNTIMNLEFKMQNGMQNPLNDIVITNLLGEHITPSAFGISPKGETCSIDISNLQNGIYFVSVKTTDGMLTKKIVVQH